MTADASTGLLTGEGLRAAFAGAAEHLRASAQAVDAINVYPVPDGDTGSNMGATLREAVDATSVLPQPVAIDTLLQTLARGALYGARGNSGVILSQALRGFSEGVGARDHFDAAALADGLSAASEAAYRAVSKPVEGTMLTVLRAAGDAAAAGASMLPDGGRGHPCVMLLRAVIEAAEDTETHTTEMLPLLAEAGVPDAGGEGVCVILRGLHGAITGEVPSPPRMPGRAIATIAGHAQETFGFCTEFVVEASKAALDLERVRALAGSNGNRSVVVVGDESAVRVHAHSDDPEGLLAAAASMGRVTRAKIDDMSAQNVRFQGGVSGATAKVGLLALSRGAGFDAIFESLGAAVADLGDVVKPPAGDIAAAADAQGRADVIVLPNHKNVVLAARQAASLARCTIHVLEAETLPHGIAAALAFDGDEPAARNLEAMSDALGAVRTVEVTVATADRIADGVEVSRGDAIALVDGTLVHACPEPTDALLTGLSHARAGAASLVTLYGGADLPEGALANSKDLVADRFPGVEVEALAGGQPLYVLIASVE